MCVHWQEVSFCNKGVHQKCCGICLPRKALWWLRGVAWQKIATRKPLALIVARPKYAEVKRHQDWARKTLRLTEGYPKARKKFWELEVWTVRAPPKWGPWNEKKTLDKELHPNLLLWIICRSFFWQKKKSGGLLSCEWVHSIGMSSNRKPKHSQYPWSQNQSKLTKLRASWV